MDEDGRVVVWTEFGRTPKTYPSAGRDHYPDAWTNFVAGGNIRGGQVVGATNAKAINIFGDLFATLYSYLGIVQL